MRHPTKADEEPRQERILHSAVILGRLKHLAKRPISAPGANITGKGWEILYELEVAVKLRNTNRELSFGEPDIIATIPETGEILGFACKRPRKLSALQGCLKKAVNQLSASRQVGLIVVGLDGLLRHAIDLSATRESFNKEAEQEMARAIATAYEQAAHALDKWSVGGLFYTCRFTTLLREPSCYYYLNLVRSIPAVEKEGMAIIGGLVSRLLREEFTASEAPQNTTNA